MDITPKETIEHIRGCGISDNEFKNMHHRDTSIESHIKYLMIIDTYRNNGNNYALAVKIKCMFDRE